MSLFTTLSGVVLLALIMSFVTLTGIYNGLVRKRNMAEEAWSGIDVQLKRRADLVPNLVEATKGYMSHEREVLENVTKARASVGAAETTGARMEAENNLSGALGRLLIVAENYPELKADKTFADLQDNMSKIEDQLQMARRYYNGAVRDLNIGIQSFPSNMIAGTMGFREMDFFELTNEADREAPKVSFSAK